MFSQCRQNITFMSHTDNCRNVLNPTCLFNIDSLFNGVKNTQTELFEISLIININIPRRPHPKQVPLPLSAPLSHVTHISHFGQKCLRRAYVE